MRDKAVVILKFMTTFVLILIGVGIWLYFNQEKEEQQPAEPEIKEEELDIKGDVVKSLPFPDMQEGCNVIETIGRYGEKSLKRDDIELSEKIDTAYKKLSVEQEESISAQQMRQYVITYWGEIEDYQDFSFTINDTNYTYDEEDDMYHIEVLNSVDACQESHYMKRYLPVILSATKKENKIIVDYAIVYYIEDSSNGSDVVYHIYQDMNFTNHIESVKESGNDLNNSASKYKSKFEHYTFTFTEENGSYYFVEGAKSNEIDSLSEIELTEETLKTINLLSLDELCLDFTEDSMYQKDHFSLESISIEERLWLAFYYSYKNEMITKEATNNDNRIEYVFTQEEVKEIYKELWGEELRSELQDFKQANFQGIVEDNQYRFIVLTDDNICMNNRKYVETKLAKAYQKDDVIYLDYKIRFIDKKGNLINIYQNQNYENPLEVDIGKTDISLDYWDLEYVTYRFVFKKQENGKYYFLEGLYI